MSTMSLADDRRRVVEIDRYRVLDPTAAPGPARAGGGGGARRRVPMATINLITDTEQHQVAAHGFDAGGLRARGLDVQPRAGRRAPGHRARRQPATRASGDNPFVTGADRQRPLLRLPPAGHAAGRRDRHAVRLRRGAARARRRPGPGARLAGRPGRGPARARAAHPRVPRARPAPSSSAPTSSSPPSPARSATTCVNPLTAVSMALRLARRAAAGAGRATPSCRGCWTGPSAAWTGCSR